MFFLAINYGTVTRKSLITQWDIFNQVILGQKAVQKRENNKLYFFTALVNSYFVDFNDRTTDRFPRLALVLLIVIFILNF